MAQPLTLAAKGSRVLRSGHRPLGLADDDRQWTLQALWFLLLSLWKFTVRKHRR